MTSPLQIFVTLLSSSVVALLPARADLPVVTAPSTLAGTVGTSVSTTVVATNSPDAYFAATPPGLTVDPVSGLLSGTPEFPYHGALAIFARNASGTVGRLVGCDLRTPSGLSLAPLSSSEPAIVGRPFFGAALAYRNSTYAEAGVTFTAQGLPPGLSMAENGRISGVPARPGSFNVLVTASSLDGGTSRVMPLAIAAAPVDGPTRIIAVTGPSAATFQAGVTCRLVVHFSAPVVVQGQPRLAVTVGTVTRYAMAEQPLDGRGAATELPLTLSFEAADTALSGIAVADRLDLNRGSITDASGQTVATTFSAPDLSGVRVVPVPPPVPRIYQTTLANGHVVLRGTGSGIIFISRRDVGVIGASFAENGRWSFDSAVGDAVPDALTLTAQARLFDGPVYSESSAPVHVTVVPGSVAQPVRVAAF